MFDIKDVRNDFPMLKQKMQGSVLVYFDNAATSLKPKCVVDAEMDYYFNYCSNAHRGDYDFAHKVDVEYDLVRSKVAKFINANSDEIVFTSGTSMSINMIAYGLSKNIHKEDEIILSEAEHASNILPWFKVSELTGCKIRYVDLDENGRLTLENLKKVLNKNTKIVSLAHLSNVLGYSFDVRAFADEIHKFNAIFVLDGAQSVPHIKVDVKELDVDFLSFSAHKMLGPTGVGVLYGKYDILNSMEPFMTGGGMNSKFDMCGNIGYLNAPLKFEAGTQNIAGVIGFGAAIDYINKLGIENIQKREKELYDYALKKILELDNVIVYNAHSDAAIITFNIKGVFAQDIASLFNKYGIAVRSGQHCAKILLDKLGTDATVRASFQFYNTFEEIDRFIEVCKKGGDFLDAFFD